VTIASFLDLCLDAHTGNAVALARFWHRVLGGTFVDHGDESARLDLPGGTRFYVDPVPEARTGGTRVHLDLRLPAPDPQPLVAAGATLRREPGGDIAWWVLTDPEGNEFCAFPPRPEPPGPGTAQPVGDGLAHVYELVVGAADAGAQAAWWASVLGGTARTGDGGAYVEGAAKFPWEYLVFDPLHWPKAVKNRMHWDVDITGPTPDALVAAGARVLREPGEVHWWVMADPEGNEFCAFPPKS
jgi:hypothetical protein